MEQVELKEDNIGAKYLWMKNTVSFSELCNYTVELPASKHGSPEVKAAKMNKIRNLKDYDAIKEVPDEGQEMIASQQVITQKEKHDGQKQACKARLVAKGFKESLKPQSDSPTASKESFKMLMAVASNSGLKLASVDIRAAFLQSKVLDREVFKEPPSDVKKQGWIWKLRKPLHGLDDASRMFWLHVKEVFLCELGFQTIHGDEAFYYSNVEGILQETILTRVDDFYTAGTPDLYRKRIDHV